MASEIGEVERRLWDVADQLRATLASSHPNIQGRFWACYCCAMQKAASLS